MFNFSKMGLFTDKMKRDESMIAMQLRPPRLRPVMWKFRGQNAFDDTIFAPSFILANLCFNYITTTLVL